MTQKQNGGGSGRSHGSSSRAMPEFLTGPQTVDELLMLGEKASSLLGNEVLNLAYQQTMQSLTQQILESAPEEVKKREGLYWTQQGATAFLTMLAGYVQQAQAEADKIDTRHYREHQATTAGVPLSEI